MTDVPTQILVDRIKKRLAKLIDNITEKELATLIDVAMALKSIECEFKEINKRLEEIESRQLERKLQIVKDLRWLRKYIKKSVILSLPPRALPDSVELESDKTLNELVDCEIERQIEDIIKILNDRKDLPHKTLYEILKEVIKNGKSVRTTR